MRDDCPALAQRWSLAEIYNVNQVLEVPGNAVARRDLRQSPNRSGRCGSGVGEEEVTPEATLVGDLGAESIDFLDIVFRLEKAFDIKIPRGELFPEDILNNAEFVHDGKVTAPGIEKLKQRLPFADLTKFEANPVVQDFVLVLTVQDLVRYVEGKLKQKSGV